MENIEKILKKKGFFFDEGILGGTSSEGYYDKISDLISGYDLDSFNEEKLNEWYDHFDLNSFEHIVYEKDELEDYDLNIDGIKPGIYWVGKKGYGGQCKIEKEKITLYANPILSSIDNDENYIIFWINENEEVEPMISKEELKKKLLENPNNPASWSII